MPKIAAGATNKNISIAPSGTGKVVVGTGAADATLQSDGDHNLVLKTGNSTTGKIEIVDGDNGNIDITPNGTGEVDIPKVDIDGGAVDGITLGTNSAVTEAQIDNINVDGNAITSTNTNGNIDLTPAGTGEVNISKVDIDSGAIDGTTIGTSTIVTSTIGTSDVTVGSEKTLDVSAGTLTTSTAQKQAIIDGATIPGALPTQTGNADKILTTDATDASWTPTHKMVASTDAIQRPDGTAVLSVDASNVATLNNVALGAAVTASANQPAIKTALNATGDAPIYACRAWVFFLGTDTGTFTGANVSSVTDNGSGDYTINFDVDFPSTNYCVAAMGGGVENEARIIVQPNDSGYRTVGSLRIYSLYENLGYDDSDNISVAFFA